MNKTDLVTKVAEATGHTKKDATTCIEAVFGAISDALANGEKVSIAGFGNFDVRERKARTGVNPTLLKQLKEQGVDAESAKVQATIPIDASKNVGFKPAKALKDSVQ